MAIYHLSVKVIGRNSGRSSVGAAAYRAGDRLTNEYDGVTHDYTNKKGIEYSEIILPDNAPKEYYNRETLWNAVEKIEKTKDAQLAREIEVALPIELELEEQKELVRNFIRENFVDEGMCVDFAIHNPAKEEKGIKFLNYNPHAHIMMTMRPLNNNGNWQKKSLIEYVCTRNGSGERRFTATEFENARKEGWQKQYKFKDGSKQVWLTMKEGKKQGLERISRNPKTSKYGRQNPTIKRWNDVETEKMWRLNWEIAINTTLEKLGFDGRVDCRSFKAQGRNDEIPSVHIGIAATAGVKRVKNDVDHTPRSDRAMINKEIQEYNKLAIEIKNEISKINQRIDDLSSATLNKLERLTMELHRCIQSRNELMIKNRDSEYQVEKIKNTITELKNCIDKIKSANDKSASILSALYSEKGKLSIFENRKKAELDKKIFIEAENIKTRNEYLKDTLNGFNLVNASDINNLMYQCTEIEEEQRKQIEGVLSLLDEIKGIAGELLQCLYIMGDSISYDYSVNSLNEELRKNDIILEAEDIETINAKYGTNYSIRDIENIPNKDLDTTNSRGR